MNTIKTTFTYTQDGWHETCGAMVRTYRSKVYGDVVLILWANRSVSIVRTEEEIPRIIHHSDEGLTEIENLRKEMPPGVSLAVAPSPKKKAKKK